MRDSPAETPKPLTVSIRTLSIASTLLDASTLNVPGEAMLPLTVRSAPDPIVISDWKGFEVVPMSVRLSKIETLPIAADPERKLEPSL